MNPYLAIIIANVIMGMTAPIMKMGLEEIPPFILGFVRFASASILLAPFVITRWQPLSKRNWLILILAGVFGIGLAIGLAFLGLKRTQSIVGPIISSSGPVILYVIAILFLNEKFNLKKFYGMFIALGGVLLIIFAPLILNGTGTHHREYIGNLLMFGATIFGVLHSFLIKKLSGKIDVLQISLVVYVSGALTMLPFTFSEMQSWSYEEVTIRGWFALLFGIFFVSLGAYTLIHYALTKIAASDVGMFVYMDPVIALLIAWPLLGESPDIFYFLGSILVFGGIYLAEGRLHWHPIHKLVRSSTLPSKPWRSGEF